MTERMLQEYRAGDGRLRYWAAGSGETVVAIVNGERAPTGGAFALLAERRHLVVFPVAAGAAQPRETARQLAATLAALGIVRFDLSGEGAGAATALWLALEPQADVGSVVLVAPDGMPDEAFCEMRRPVLLLTGTEDQSDAGDHYRTLLPDCHFMLVYGAGRTIADERPEALAFIALEFFERRGLFLVSRESGIALP